MIVYFLKDSLKLEEAKKYDFPNDTKLGQVLEHLELNPEEIDIYNSDGIVTDLEASWPTILIAPRIESKAVKNVFKVIVGAALLLASGGALGAIAGFLHTTGTVVHALGAGLLLGGGGALIKGQMQMPQISSFGSEAVENSYEWNVGNLSTSKGPKGVTFGNNVAPEGELLAFRTFGETDDEPITSSRTDTWVDTTFIAGNSTKAGTTTKKQNVTDRYGRTYTDYVTVNKYKHSKTVTSIIGSKITDSSQILELLIGAGEGPVTIDTSSIKINGTPISDIPEAEYAVRSGTNNQTPFNSVIDNQTFNLSINATLHQILYGEVESDWPDAVTYTTPSACQSVEIAFSSGAWYLMDMTSGAHNKAYLAYQIRYRKQGTTEWTLKEVTTTYPILANRAYYRSTPIKLPSSGIWEFQFQNVSARLNNQKSLLSQAEFTQIPDRAVIEIKVVSITGYSNDNRSYPNTALIYLRLPATQAINGNLPSITWRQSRSNCWVWTGSEYVQKPLNNLAWAIYDCLVQIRLDQFDNSLHVLGWNKDKVDYNAFVDFADFCDDINAKGNWFLSRKTSVFEMVQDLAVSCRASIGFRYGKICPFWDCPKEMTQIFTAGNMIDNSYSGGFLLPANRATQLDCTFNDENNNYESTTIRVSLDGIDDGTDAGSVTFVGLTSVDAVYNAAYYLLRRNKYLKRTFNFSAGRDALVAEVGDVVGIQLDVMRWGAGGRVMKVEGNKITLDRNVTLQSGTDYSLKITHPDGTLERQTPDETSGTYATLTFSQHPFATNVVPYDVYTFGVFDAECKPFKIESITSDYNQVNFEIECSEYNPNVYEEGSAPEIDYSRLNAGISDYTATANANGDIDLTWKASEGTAYVKVYVGDTFVGVGTNGFTINGANSTSNIRLIPVSSGGYDGTAVTSAITAHIGTPSIPVIPILVPFSTGVIAAFDPVPVNEYITQLIIFENGSEIASVPVDGSVVSIQIQLSGGSHNLVACYRNVNGVLGTGRSFVAASRLIDAPDVVADWIISGVFETAQGVGSEVDGVRFDSNGIEGWYNGSCHFDLNANGLSRIGGWYIGERSLYNSNIELSSEGRIQTMDYTSGHRGWFIGKEGNAEFNDIRARGAIKSTVFEYDEVSVIGGQQLVRSGGVLDKDYDSTIYLQKYADSVLNAEYSILNKINDTSYTRESTSFSSYQEYYDYERSLWQINNIILDYSQFGLSIPHEEDYSVEAATAELSACFTLLNQIDDTTYTMPAISSSLTYAQYVELEEGYWDKVSTINDDPFGFIPGISDTDSVLYLRDTAEFKVGDIIRIKDGLANDYWGQVEKKGTDTNGSFLAVKGRHGSLFSMDAGQTVVDYGGATSGGVLLDGNAPLIDIYTHDGEPWNGTDCWVRIGNLKGINHIGDDRYGMFLGNPNGQFMMFDERSGKLLIRGEMEISEGPIYDAIEQAQETAESAIGISESAYSIAESASSTAGSASSTASSAYSIASTASTNATAAINFRNAVANSDYTSIKGGVIKTGIIKSTGYSGVTDGSAFATTGMAINLDNGTLTAPGLRWNTTFDLTLNGDVISGLDGGEYTFTGNTIKSASPGNFLHDNITEYFPYVYQLFVTNVGYMTQNGDFDSGLFRFALSSSWTASGLAAIYINNVASDDYPYKRAVILFDVPTAFDIRNRVTDVKYFIGNTSSEISTSYSWVRLSSTRYLLVADCNTSSVGNHMFGLRIYFTAGAMDTTYISYATLTQGVDKYYYPHKVILRNLVYNSSKGYYVASSNYVTMGPTVPNFIPRWTVGYLTGSRIRSYNIYASYASFSTVKANSCNQSSDERKKENIEDVSVLEKIKDLRVKRWNFKEDVQKLSHIGPMARDFNELFEVDGENIESINLGNMAGVALRAIQELAEKIDALENAKPLVQSDF